MASLWKILTGAGAIAAAPFTAGTSLSLLAPSLFIGGASLAAGGALEKKGGGLPSSKLDTSTLIGKQNTLSDKLVSSGLDLSKSGEDDVDTSLKFLTRILTGDRAAMTETLAPEYETILSQYDTAKRAIIETGPRGGGKGEKIAEAEFSKASDFTRLLERMRPIIAEKVAAIGGERARRGYTPLALGSQTLSDIVASLTQKRGQNLQTFGDVGQGIGSIIASLVLKGG